MLVMWIQSGTVWWLIFQPSMAVCQEIWKWTVMFEKGWDLSKLIFFKTEKKTQTKHQWSVKSIWKPLIYTALTFLLICGLENRNLKFFFLIKKSIQFWAQFKHMRNKRNLCNKYLVGKLSFLPTYQYHITSDLEFYISKN